MSIFACSVRPSLVFLLSLGLLIGGVSRTRGQDPEFDVPDPDAPAASAAPDEAGEPAGPGSTGAMLLLGTSAGVAGFLGGFYLGVAIGDHDDGYLDGLDEGMLVGSVVGGLAMPLGIHGANHGRGSLPLVLTTSLLVGGAGWLAAVAADDGAYLLATPIAQLIACTMVEVSTDPGRGHSARDPRPEDDRAADRTVPRIDVGAGLVAGRPGLVIHGTF